MTSKKKLQSIVNDIRTFCQSHADEAVAQRYARYFTEGYDAYGIPKELMFEQKAKWKKTHGDQLSLADALKLGEMLLQSGKYEEASFALFSIEPYRGQYTADTFQSIGAWLEKGICNWGHTDCLCCDVLSYFLKNQITDYQSMADWRDSKSKWKRRGVPVTMLCLAKKQQKDIKPLLEFVEPLMMDKDRFVQQGLGWFLRELWKKHPKPVEAFLLKWKDSAPRKIYQYATEKMTKEDKARFRRGKVK